MAQVIRKWVQDSAINNEKIDEADIYTITGLLVDSTSGAGRIGIGVTDPLDAVHIRRPDTSAGLMLDLNDGSDGRNYQLYSSSTGVFNIQDHDIATDRFSLKSTASLGNIGISTSDPQDTIHARAEISSAALRLDLDDTGSGRAYQIASNSLGDFTIRDLDDATTRLTIDSAGATTIHGDATILNGMEVFGTVTVINTEIVIADQLEINQTDDEAALIVSQDTSSASATVMLLENAGSGHALTTDNGNVGLGTTNPAALLHVEGDIVGKVSASGSNLGSPSRRFSTLYMNSHINHVGNLNFNGTNVTFDSTAGRVGIGCTLPAQPLDVLGNITANAGSVTGALLTSTGHIDATSGTITGGFLVSNGNVTATAGTGIITGNTVNSAGDINAVAGGATITGTSIVSNGNITATAGTGLITCKNLVATTGNITATAGTGIITANAVNSNGVITAGGNIDAVAGGAIITGTSIESLTNITATTGTGIITGKILVATTGDITATAGNITATGTAGTITGKNLVATVNITATAGTGLITCKNVQANVAIQSNMAVGIGTAGGATSDLNMIENSTVGPTIRLESSRYSLGAQPSATDKQGEIVWYGKTQDNNTVQTGRIFTEYTANPTATGSTYSRMGFVTYDSGSEIESLTVASTGSFGSGVGIGSTLPRQSLDVAGGILANNIGVGTASVSTAKVHAYGASGTSELLVETGTVTGTDIAKLTLQQDGATQAVGEIEVRDDASLGYIMEVMAGTGNTLYLGAWGNRTLEVGNTYAKYAAVQTTPFIVRQQCWNGGLGATAIAYTSVNTPGGPPGGEFILIGSETVTNVQIVRGTVSRMTLSQAFNTINGDTSFNAAAGAGPGNITCSGNYTSPHYWSSKTSGGSSFSFAPGFANGIMLLKYWEGAVAYGAVIAYDTYGGNTIDFIADNSSGAIFLSTGTPPSGFVTFDVFNDMAANQVIWIRNNTGFTVRNISVTIVGGR